MISPDASILWTWFEYVWYAAESYNRGWFVVCDVSADWNERCLRGGVSLSNCKEPRTKGTLQWIFVLVDSPPLDLLSSFDQVRPLVRSLSGLVGLTGREDASRTAPGERQKYITHRVVLLAPQGHSYHHLWSPSSWRSTVRWQEVKTKIFLVIPRYEMARWDFLHITSLSNTRSRPCELCSDLTRCVSAQITCWGWLSSGTRTDFSSVFVKLAELCLFCEVSLLWWPSWTGLMLTRHRLNAANACRWQFF